jgi:hypothetical protein
MDMLILAALALFFGLSWWLVRSRRLAGERSHRRDALAHFAAAFVPQGVPRPLIEETFAYLYDRALRTGENDAQRLIISPAHDLREVYHMDELDIEDAALVIADRAGGRLPRAHALDELRGRVRTIADLVAFLAPYFQPELIDG